MKGQLWEECSKRKCDTEPVCADCGYCERHCSCESDQRERAAFEKANPGFLDKLAIHHEQGKHEK